MTLPRINCGELPPELRSARRMCHRCNKWSYVSRRAARRIIRTVHVGDKLMMAYRCPVDGDVWHVGHSNGRRIERNNVEPAPFDGGAS